MDAGRNGVKLVEIDEQRLRHCYQCGLLLGNVEIVDKRLFELGWQDSAAESGFVVSLWRDEQRSHTVAVATVLANPLRHHAQKPFPEPFLPLRTVGGHTVGK